MSLQTMFYKYNDLKSLTNSEYNEMREKRDIIVEEIRGNKELPSFTIINLGSYKLKTGVNYKDNSYDIDCGLIFSNLNGMTANQFKQAVYDAIHNKRKKKFNTKCLTASYMEEGKSKYHIDFAIYFLDDSGQHYLADGKQGEVEWTKAEPRKLIDYLNYDSLTDIQRDTYRRTVKFLKLWKQRAFSSSSSDAIPPSIALNITSRQYFNSIVNKHDINHLIQICSVLQTQFNTNGEKLYLRLPYTHYNENVFYKVIREDKYVDDYKEKLDAFINSLIYARDCGSLDSACKELKKYFPDFPQPEKQKSNKNPYSRSGRYGI